MNFMVFLYDLYRQIGDIKLPMTTVAQNRSWKSARCLQFPNPPIPPSKSILVTCVSARFRQAISAAGASKGARSCASTRGCAPTTSNRGAPAAGRARPRGRCRRRFQQPAEEPVAGAAEAAVLAPGSHRCHGGYCR